MTIFDRILNGEIPAWRVCENDSHLAFLTPFPDTPGVTVVIPKTNVGDYLFSLTADDVNGLMAACREVAALLERAFDTPRVACVFEGTGVPHVHEKLYPLIGRMGAATDVWSPHLEFAPEYRGFITKAEGPQAQAAQLDIWQQLILAAAESGAP